MPFDMFSLANLWSLARSRVPARFRVWTLVFSAAAGCGGGATRPGTADAAGGPDQSSGGGGVTATGGSRSGGSGGQTTGSGGATPDGGSPDGGSFDGSWSFAPWPGANMVAVADAEDVFGTDLSGLVLQPADGTSPSVLWGVHNRSGKLYRLTWNGTLFSPVTTDGWRTGKRMRYPGGDGQPDCEGVTMADWASGAVYVAAERDDDSNTTSRLSILRYETASTATALTATHEWNLTADLPAVDANKGLEGIAWVPDSFLVARGFFDEAAGKTYVPAEHPNHGTGLFFVGVEADGRIHGYALDHTAMTFRRVASIAAPQEATMDLFFDRDVGTLWSWCDDTCGNRVVLLDIDSRAGSPTHGRFVPRRGFNRAGTLPNEGHEGIAIAPESECAAGADGTKTKAFVWADDSNTDGHALRRDLIPCGPLY